MNGPTAYGRLNQAERDFVCGLVAHLMDTKERKIRTKKELVKMVERCFWGAKKKSIRISPANIKACIDRLNGTREYLILYTPEGGYQCSYGPRSNSTMDMLATIRNISHIRGVIAKTMETGVIVPLEIAVKKGIPESSKTLIDAQQRKNMLFAKDPLQEASKRLTDISKTDYRIQAAEERTA